MSLPKLGTEKDIEAIDGRWRSYGERMLSHDTDRYMELWHSDGIRLPPDGPVVVGKEAIHAAQKDDFSRVEILRCEVSPKETQLTSDTTAYSWGRYLLEYAMREGGEERKMEGIFMTVLVKDSDGSWKMYRDCFNQVSEQE